MAWLRNAPPRHTVKPVVRRVVLTILTLVVLLPSAAFAGVRYLCAMDGQVRSACCCPAKTHKQEPNTDPQTDYGHYMPDTNPHLPMEQIQAIKDWIDRGALKSEPATVSGNKCTLTAGDMAVHD